MVVGVSEERRLDKVFEFAMLILVGIPVLSILFALVLAFCLICLPFFIPIAAYEFLSLRRCERARSHPLSDWTLGVLPVPIVPADQRCQAEPTGPNPVSFDRQI